jgi:uncharacterized ParB-like nuclease family protein
MWALGTRSLLLLAEGRLSEASCAAERASALVKQTKPIHVGGVEAYGRVALVQLAVWGAAPRHQAYERATQARGACADLAAASRIFPIAIPSYCLYEGTRRWMLGQSTRAMSIWRRGLKAARKLRLEHRETQLLLALGKYAPTGREREEALVLGKRGAARLGIHDDSIFLPSAKVNAPRIHRN